MKAIENRPEWRLIHKNAMRHEHTPERCPRDLFRLEILRGRLLTRWLKDVPRIEFHATIFHAANEAASLAWQTAFPLLVFPVLFEEKAQAMLNQARRQQRVREQSLQLVATAF